MSTYLEKLRARKRQKGQPGEVQKQQKAKAVPVGRGAITAKTPSCTFCSTPKRPFSENAAIPSFCRVDCLNFQLSTVADLPPVLRAGRLRTTNYGDPSGWTRCDAAR